jgi:very-short-patch-repair endonuclease
MDAKSAARDARVARMAARQHGVVSAAQLREAGFSKDAIRRRVDGGRFHPVHQRVYAIGYRNFTDETRWMAAVLACRGHGEIGGGDAFLSHRSAAALWRLLAPRGGPVDVAIVGEAGRTRRPGLRIHRPRTLELTMTTTRLGIPVTNPRRTLVDLRRARPNRGSAGARDLRRAMRQAAALGLDLGPGVTPERTRSELESLFLHICRRHGIDAPEVNVRVGPFEVDFLWRDQRAIVEADGYRYHRGRVAFDDDRRRDLSLRELGFDVLRLSDAQLAEEPATVAAAVQRLLAAD